MNKRRIFHVLMTQNKLKEQTFDQQLHKNILSILVFRTVIDLCVSIALYLNILDLPNNVN